MDIIEKKRIDMLTKDSVSILTQKFITIDGVETQVGENHRCSYSNSEMGRNDISTNEPEYVVNSVFVVWGDEPTIVEDPSVEDPESEITKEVTDTNNETVVESEEVSDDIVE